MPHIVYIARHIINLLLSLVDNNDSFFYNSQDIYILANLRRLLYLV